MPSLPTLPAEQPRPSRHAPNKRRKSIRRAMLSHWESVREEREQWLQPFYKLPIERAMAYLEDLRNICEQAGYVMNERIGKDPNKMRCASKRCGKDLSGTLPNGRPKWIAKKDFKDKLHPEIIRSVYFCCELHHNEWVREQQGAMGGDGR